MRGLLIAGVSFVAEHGLWSAQASGVAACWLSGCGIWACDPRSMWDLPRPGIELVSPALVDRFFTTRKVPVFSFDTANYSSKLLYWFMWTSIMGPSFRPSTTRPSQFLSIWASLIDKRETAVFNLYLCKSHWISALPCIYWSYSLYFFPNKKLFYWSTVAFYCISEWLSYTHTHTYIILLKMFLSIMVHPKRLDLVPWAVQ